MKTLLILVMAAMAGLTAGSSAKAQAPAPRRLLPIDEAASRPDFFTFRAQLMIAVARRDAAALLAVVHPDIKNGFGGDDGKANFEAEWRPASADSKVWAELAAVLALGGTFGSADTFIAPYVFSRWPPGVDGFEHVAIVGDGVRLRESASTESAQIAESRFEILPLVRLDNRDPLSADWIAVRLSSGKTAFVAAKYVRSPIDYRAFFSKESGRWQMMMFLAGD